MAEQLPLGYADRFSLMLDRAGAEQADRLRRYSGAGAAQTLARTADNEAARVVGLAAGDIASREAGVGAVEGMSGRPTDVDFADSAARRFASTPPRSVPASKAAKMQATLGRLRRLLESGMISQAEYTAEVARAEAAMRLPEGARGTSPGGVASEYGRPTSPGGVTPVEARPTSSGGVTPVEARPTSSGGVTPVEARPTSPGGVTPVEVRRTFPGSDVLDAPPGPRDSALRLTDAGTDVSQNYQASRVTSSGEPLQRARQAARVADPEFGRATEPFMPGTQQARLDDVQPTTVDRHAKSRRINQRVRTPPAERLTTVDRHAKSRRINQRVRTPPAERLTTVDQTPFTERAAVQGESALARQGTPTAADPLSPAERAFESSPRTSSFATTADDAASLLSRAKGVARKVGEVASAGFKSPVARGISSLPVAAATTAMELEKYFDPRGKSFTDDVEMMHENINRIRSGARGSSSAPAPLSYADIRVRDDMPSNYRGLLGAVTGNLGTATGGNSARSRLSEIGGFTEVQRLIDQNILDENFVKDAVKDMSYQERENMFARNMGLPSNEFKVVVDALGGPAAPDMQSYVYSLEKQVPEAAERLNRDFSRQIAEGVFDETPAAGAPKALAAEKPKAPAAKAPKASTAGAPKSKKSSFPILAVGARGGEVTNIQQRLAGMGYEIGSEGADGKFGKNTKAAVKKFQSNRGLAADGIVGQDTYAAFTDAANEARSAAKPGTEPEAVTPQFGAGLTRVDEGAFNDAATAFEDMKDIDPVKSDRRTPTQNTEAYLDLELDEEPRRTAFPLYRGRRNRK